MPRKYNKQKGLIWNEGGFLELNKNQTRLRWRMCKEALNSKKYSIELKGCYDSKEEMLPFCSLFWNSHAEFDAIYTKILGLGWRSEFKNYLDDSVPEGSFFPFVRFQKQKSRIVDTGCIWIGSRGFYPRIHVDNKYCKWYYPMNLSGRMLAEGFVPMGEIKKYQSILKKESTVRMLEQWTEEV